jgi:plastocyanin
MRAAVLLALVALAAAAPATAGTVTGTVTVRGAPAGDAVVYLEGGRAAAAPAGRVTMDQRNLSFVPAVLPVVRGTVVEFTNGDDVQHNVFTPSRAGGRFDLGTYSRGQSRQVTLAEAGEVVVLCNIHMEMEARILVLDEPTFAVTGPEGAFTLRDVPPGRYRLRLWKKGWLAHEEPVTVVDEGPLRVDVRAAR